MREHEENIQRRKRRENIPYISVDKVDGYENLQGRPKGTLLGSEKQMAQKPKPSLNKQDALI